METRALGRQGLVVSAQGLGCLGMSEFYAGRDDTESISTIHRALDLGVETIDLYYHHRVDRTVPIEETVGVMAGLVSEG